MNNIKVNVKALEGEKDYKHMLISAIEKIDNEKFIKFFYELFVSFKRKWGI